MVPWWSPEIKEKIALKKKALNKFRRNPTLENLVEFKKRRSQCRRGILEAQRISWQHYVTTMTPETTSNDVWKKVGAISGKNSCSHPVFLRNSDGIITNKLQDITNIIADQFYKVSSSSNYSNTFLDTKPFTVEELEAAIRNTKSCSPGEDAIHNQMLRHCSSLRMEASHRNSYTETRKRSVAGTKLSPN
uniref:Uncharacterized protein n=2 Tax=Photinus pyralis TaxID=7054 RepID=A0A1Y1KIK3_PHOPY